MDWKKTTVSSMNTSCNPSERKAIEATITFIQQADICISHHKQYVSRLAHSPQNIEKYGNIPIYRAKFALNQCLSILLFAKQEMVCFLFKGVPKGNTYS